MARGTGAPVSAFTTRPVTVLIAETAVESGAPVPVEAGLRPSEP